jgi:hypothetical protein
VFVGGVVLLFLKSVVLHSVSRLFITNFKIQNQRFVLCLLISAICILLLPRDTVAGTETVAFRWNPSASPVAGYKFCYGRFSRNYDYVVDVGKSTSCSISGLVKGTTYYFAVKAYDYKGFQSKFSKEISYNASGSYDGFVPGPDWCRDNGPCSEGQGDCDGDAQCQSGLICAQNVGAKYGWPANRDVCERPSGSVSYNASGSYDGFVPGPDWCRDNGPCSEGQGDCDGDAQCQSGLICAQNVGAKYGWPANRDVCEFP